MTDTALDLGLIRARYVEWEARQEAAYGLPGGDASRAAWEAAMDCGHDVPALLAEVERLRNADRDGYLRGLRAAAGLLASFDQDLPGFDRKTCRRLGEAVRAMVASAEERLCDPARPTPHLDAVKAQRDALASALASALSALLHAVESGAGWSDTQEVMDRAREALKRVQMGGGGAA